mgnify:CR=1 FL=1
MKKRLALLLSLAAAGLLSGCSTTPQSTGVGASFRGPIGLQLYSLRAQFIKNVPGTLDVVQGTAGKRSIFVEPPQETKA